jgi:non-specific serine/threonine protein kinase
MSMPLSPTPSSLIGETILHYRIVEKLAQGGMGVVYKAQDTELERHVALKFLSESFAADAQALERFRLEARAAASLSHPHICTIHDLGDRRGQPFIVMELVEGSSLKQLAAEGELDVDTVLELGVQITDALSAAHAKGIVHRDIKTSNILVNERGDAKILDFGLAQLGKLVQQAAVPADGAEVDGEDTLVTDSGEALGTVPYMSPEQARGQLLDARTDLFSFGAVLYEIATSEQAFTGRTSAVVFDAILNKSVQPPRQVDSEIPAELERIILKALEKDRDLRYQTASGMRADLLRLRRDLEFAQEEERDAVRARRRDEGIDSLAVLPFTNTSGDPRTEYFSDGVTESILNSLSQLPRLRVVSRNTAFRYKGRAIDQREAARELDVRAIVTGRVSQRGSSLMVSAELVDVEADAQLWGANYKRKSQDIFAVQEDIAHEISSKLQLRLTHAERRRLAKRHTESTAAYEAYLRGRYEWNRRDEPGLHKAVDFFKQAIREDPRYAMAYTGLSDSYHILGYYNAIPSLESWRVAKEASDKALEFDPGLAEAITSSAAVAAAFDWDWERAEELYARSKELNPNYPTTHHWFAFLMLMLGRVDEAVASMRRALELDPLSLIINTDVGWCLYYARRYDEAVEQYKRTLDIEERFAPALYSLAQVCAQMRLFDEAIAILSGLSGTGYKVELAYTWALAGRRDEAQQGLREVEQLAEQTNVAPCQFAKIHVGLNEHDTAFELLERAFEERSPALTYLKTEPWFDPLQSDPRLRSLADRMDLP